MKFSRNSLIALIITGIYFVSLMVMLEILYDSTIGLLQTVFFIPTATVWLFGYGGQSDFIIWTVVLIEMGLLFIILKLFFDWIAKNKDKIMIDG